MREIKFRGQETETKEWRYGFYFNHAGVARIFVPEKGSFCVIPESVGQFTGRQCKNGNDVYEGDIITCEIYERESYNDSESGEQFQVYFDTNSASFMPFGRAAQWRSGVEDIEIIGKIHETP